MQLSYFGLVFWFGLYMINRDVRNVRLWLAGLGLIVCSIGIGAVILLPHSQEHQTMAMPISKVRDICSYLPLVLWQGAILSAAAGKENKRSALWLLWKHGLTGLTLCSMIWLAFVESPIVYGVSYKVAVCMFFILSAVFSIGGAVSNEIKRPLPFYVFIYSPLLVFSCMMALNLLFPGDAWNKGTLMANGAGMLLFGAYTMIKEIRDQGESWLPDLFRSLDYSVFFTLIFSGQVALVILLGTGTGFDFTTLSTLMVSIMVSIAFQVFVYPIRALLDNIALMMFPKLRTERSKLRLVESVQVRIDEYANPEEMDDEELYRHIRRATSNLGNLERLASSPLAQLKLIDERIRKRGAADGVVERANELKSLLIESILQLKPRRDEQFGTTDEWKFYNALYFPYVVGIKPYSVRYSDNQLDVSSIEALKWFRTCVPERTCYNWQNAGARLIATSLREKNALIKAQ
ncbi:hypothetical protein [Cohnella terricola]|uniref:hypothetical protein n=1 Tax=Cohnella terricola TaxID=1289167 RepID=UPI001FEC9419|nr:hypothetical protein [Cohnella terricola]